MERQKWWKEKTVETEEKIKSLHREKRYLRERGGG